MTHEDALSLQKTLDWAKAILVVAEQFPPTEPSQECANTFARALLSLSTRCDSMSAVCDSVRNWRHVMRGPMPGNRIEALWRDEQVCQALLAAIDSLDADKERG